jgi:DNA-directed RNA polymerase sigma subunit (sigma70/sigma32)
MSYFGKDFVKSFNNFKAIKKRLRIESDLVQSRLRKVRSEVSQVEYYILKMRILDKPMSMDKIAEGLAKEGILTKKVSRQRIDKIISDVIKKLDK